MANQILEAWKSFTISESFFNLKNAERNLFNQHFNESIQQELMKSKFFLQVKDRKIIGNCVEGIEGVYNGEDLNFYISLSEIFHDSIDLVPKHAPIFYILKIAKKLIDLREALKPRGLWKDEYWGFLGRAFRGFASFFRDYDAFNKIREIIRSKKMDHNFLEDPIQESKLDSKGHTDILVLCKTPAGIMKFRIWLFQSTKRGLINLIERIAGFRGVLGEGFHFLLPINIFQNDSKVENIHKWVLYSPTYLNSIIEIIIDIMNQNITSFIDYDYFKKNILNINEINSKLKLSNIDYNQSQEIRNWAIKTYRRLESILNSFFYFKK